VECTKKIREPEIAKPMPNSGHLKRCLIIQDCVQIITPGVLEEFRAGDRPHDDGVIDKEATKRCKVLTDQGKHRYVGSRRG
jgi:hypothetical protein